MKRALFPFPGAVVGKLVVVSLLPPGRAAVRCACGNEEIRSVASLKTAFQEGLESKCKACFRVQVGKLATTRRPPTRVPRKEKVSPGERWGKLMVVSFSGRQGTKRCYLCLCDCGKELVRTAARISPISSCRGCASRGVRGKTPYAVEEGFVFGALTAVRPLDERKRGSVVWLLRCACGKEVSRSSASLVTSQNYRHMQGCSPPCRKRVGVWKTIRSLPHRRLPADHVRILLSFLRGSTNMTRSWYALFFFLVSCGGVPFSSGDELPSGSGDLSRLRAGGAAGMGGIAGSGTGRPGGAGGGGGTPGAGGMAQGVGGASQGSGGASQGPGGASQGPGGASQGPGGASEGPGGGLGAGGAAGAAQGGGPGGAAGAPLGGSGGTGGTGGMGTSAGGTAGSGDAGPSCSVIAPSHSPPLLSTFEGASVVGTGDAAMDCDDSTFVEVGASSVTTLAFSHPVKASMVVLLLRGEPVGGTFSIAVEGKAEGGAFQSIVGTANQVTPSFDLVLYLDVPDVPYAAFRFTTSPTSPTGNPASVIRFAEVGTYEK